MLQARLDVSCQGLDLSTAEATVDVNAGDNPYPAWADESDEELANGGHAGVAEEKGSHPLLISWPEWLGKATASWPRGPPGVPTQMPTRKSWLGWMGRRLTRISTKNL